MRFPLSPAEPPRSRVTHGGTPVAVSPSTALLGLPSSCRGAPVQRKHCQSPQHHERPPVPPWPPHIPAVPRRPGQPPAPAGSRGAAALHSSCCGHTAACLILETRHASVSKTALFFPDSVCKRMFTQAHASMAWGCGHPDVSRRLAGSELGCSEEARMKEPELLPATPCSSPPKGLSFRCWGIPGLLWAQTAEKSPEW